MKNYTIHTVFSFILLVFMQFAHADWKADYWELFETRFKNEIDLFGPVSQASVLQSLPKSRAHWDAYFRNTSVVAIGIVKTERRLGKEDDSCADTRDSIDWIWTKEEIASPFAIRSHRDVTIPKSALKTSSLPISAGEGSVRFGKHKYKEAFSLIGKAEKTDFPTELEPIEVQAICILDGR